MGLSIKEAMNIGGLAKCKVVAGEKGLHREISYVTVMEVPDVIQWLKGQDLLLTSLYPIKDDEVALQDLVKKLKQKGSAALAIKTNRYFEEIPEPILYYGNLLDFPIIEINSDTSYLDIMTPLMNVILEYASPEPEDYEELFAWITELALAGRGVDSILQALSKMMGNLVTIESVLPQVYMSPISGSIEALSIKQTNELWKSRRPLRMVRTFNGESTPCIVSPLILNNEINGVITCWSTKREFRRRDFHIMERAVPLFGLEFQKVKTKIDVEKKYKNELISSILLGNNTLSEEEAIEKGKIYGWDLTKDYQVMVLDMDQFLSIVEALKYDEVSIQEFKRNIELKAESIVQQYDPSVIVALWSDKMVILYPAIHYQEELAQRIKDRLQSQVSDVTFTVGIGRFHPGMKGLRKGYLQAIQSIQVGRKAKGRNSIHHFNSLGIYRILGEFHDQSELQAIYDETVGKLNLYDQNHNANLAETLERFFESNGGLTETAEKMFIHVNTLKYRLQKIVAITGCNIYDSEGRFHLQLGLKIKQLVLLAD
ncbi:PucR family transcriptional regulator [Ammoniphilus sp. YIM 78166]|uniref:PucR family transcriptional regulator n=1 Tax=Ammoniphilus sp. YIM 78166 TaxID=1644106 RepID=UPI00106F1847|nr:PucR family transcriptional regulator [Ammoniphilus sp. YIM 78166]